jgi:hypothetical protein
MAAKADAKGEEAKADFRIWKARLEAKAAKLRADLAEAQRQGGDAWDDVTSGLKRAFDDLDQAVTKAASRFAAGRSSRDMPPPPSSTPKEGP